MVDAGLSPMQAIMAASKWPAEYIGAKAKDMGTLERGKIADLVVLGRDPLQDITAYKDVERVMQGGRWLPVGYHYYFANPIPRPGEDAVGFSGLPPWSQTPAVITSISPEAVVEDSGEFTLTVNGKEFLSTSVVKFNGQWLETEVVSGTQLRATVPVRLIGAVGTYPVQVDHRLPGWGETNIEYIFVKFK